MKGNHTVRWGLVAMLALVPTAALAQEQGRPEPLVRQAGQTQEWDQAAVTDLAGQLTETFRDARRAFRSVPPPTAGSMQSRAHFSFRDILRVVERDSQALHSGLAKGEGHDETLPIYNRMWVSIRDGQEEGRRMMITTDLQARFTRARGILSQLDAFYD